MVWRGLTALKTALPATSFINTNSKRSKPNGGYGLTRMHKSRGIGVGRISDSFIQNPVLLISSGDTKVKRLAIKKYCLVAAISLAACGYAQSRELTYSLPDGTPDAIAKVLETSWPKVQESCPGLRKFGGDLVFVGVESNLDYAPDNAKRIELKFKVAEPVQLIPKNFAASGHRCSFGVSPDGSKLFVPKRPCASICEGRLIEDSNYSKPL